MVIGLVSAKGAPGVTAAALALTAAAGDAGLLVELDPSGGSIECWTGPAGEPGLIRVASGLRRSVDPEALLSHAVEASRGLRAVLAPTAGGLAESTIAAVADRLVPALAGLDGTVVVDAGRWSPSQSTARRLVGCEVVAVVCAPTVEGVEAARWLVEALETVDARRVVVVPVGDRPYGPGEIEEAIVVPVLGPLAWDPRGLHLLVTAGTGRGWVRSALARSARTVANWLVGAAEVVGRA
ncbi:MAG: hypothetical protein M5T61_15990 [Acidimicrobiia bacterium]|nr:hypothetical protein [Acidimicrobiia bacterium]